MQARVGWAGCRASSVCERFRLMFLVKYKISRDQFRVYKVHWKKHVRNKEGTCQIKLRTPTKVHVHLQGSRSTSPSLLLLPLNFSACFTPPALAEEPTFNEDIPPATTRAWSSRIRDIEVGFEYWKSKKGSQGSNFEPKHYFENLFWALFGQKTSE